MKNRVVEISSDGAHLSVDRGFLSVAMGRECVGKVAIEDMSALIIRGHGASFSANICARLADVNVPIVICNTNQSPASVIWPVSGHFTQGLTMQAQAVANKPMQKRLWAQLVKSKIENQAEVLRLYNQEFEDIASMAGRVKSGDIDNLEAQAARKYWKRLMGEDFIRSSHQGAINTALNYGYTILRAATARSLLAAGLHPSLSIHHQSKGDALRLADDLMEPYRPWVDDRVKRISEQIEGQEFSLTPQHKAALAAVLTIDMQAAEGASPMQVCMDRMAQSLAQVFLGNRKKLELPAPPIPLTLGQPI
ncbi:type II CRISPR-associated endonuclease Cas1 [Sneathiella limimaris]|uniref:type II CRISPR-associated endonuclease Cas1 n=1 Tax=Sneathiella limimaris TaxID=1964213 RepID=UPI001469B6D5|nr:type II CRISPR-associated endonuclease Cas1 [Sneathiella limimaris]